MAARFRCLIAGWTFWAFTGGYAHLAGAQSANEPLLGESNPAIQAQIDAMFSATSEVDVFQQTQKLKGTTKDKAELIKQLAIFAATSPRGQEAVELPTLLILHRLELNPSTIIRVLARCLGSDNEKLREFAEEWFDGFQSSAADERYKAYGSYITGRWTRSEEVPIAFVDYIFKRSPGEALLAFNRAKLAQEVTVPQLKAISEQMEARRQGRPIPKPDEKAWEPAKEESRELRLAELLIENAIRLEGFGEHFQKALSEADIRLAKLAERNEWWVRLYVAEIMGRHTYLRQIGVLEKLSADDHKLVSTAATGAIKRPPAMHR